MALNTTTGSGTQSATGTPQTVGEANTTAQSGSVQPGTATSLLNSSGGITLGNNALTTVNLTANTSATTQTATTTPAATHQVNAVAIGFCGILFVTALVIFAVMSRSAKNTT